MNKYIIAAEGYLKNCVYDGLAHSWDVDKKEYVKPYPEVTGYVIKYFCDFTDMIPLNIIEAADYLIDIQDKKTGGYYSFDREDILYSFDTAQIIRGLLAVFDRTKNSKYLTAAKKAGEFILASQEGCGAFKPYYNCNENGWVIRDETYSMWNGPFSGLMCKLTEAIIDLYKYTKDERYKIALNKTVDFYKNAQYIEYTHPLGYWLEGLIAANKFDIVEKIICEKVLSRVSENGYISYLTTLPYSYVSGTIQLGIILYKLGYRDEAERIRNYGRIVQSQDSTGGLFQYASKNGMQDKSVHSEINSWGTKYFCELERMLL